MTVNPTTTSLVTTGLGAEQNSKTKMLSLLQQLAQTLKQSSTLAGSNQDMMSSAATLADMLGELQSKIIKMMAETGASNAKIGNALIQQANDNLNKVIQQIQAYERAQAESHKWGLFGEIIGAIVGAVLAIAGCVTLDPAMALGGVAVIIMSTTPAMKDLTKGLGDLISDILVACNVSKKKADEIGKVVAAVLIVIAVIVVAVLTCGTTSASAAEEVTAEADVEMTEIGSSAADSAAGDSAAGDAAPAETSNLTKVRAALGRVLNKIPRRLLVKLCAGSQAVSSTNLIDNTISMASRLRGEKNLSEVEQKLELALSIINSVLGMLAGLGAAGQTVSSAAKLGTTSLQAARDALASKLNVNAIFTWLTRTEVVSMLLQATASAGEAATYARLGHSNDQLMNAQADLGLVNFATEQQNQRSKDMAQSSTSALKDVSEDIAKLPELAQIQEAIAHVLA